MQRGFCVGQKIGGKRLQKNYCNLFKYNTKTSIMQFLEIHGDSKEYCKFLKTQNMTDNLENTSILKRILSGDLLLWKQL